MRGRRALVVVAAVLGVLLLAGLWVGLRTKQAVDALTRARSGVSDVRRAITDGDPATARDRLAVVQDDAARAKSASSDPVYRLAASLPVVGSTLDAVRGISATADLLAQDVLGPLVDASEALDPQVLRVAAGQVNVQALEDALPPVQRAASGVTAAQQRLAAVDTAGTPSQVQDAVSTVSRQLDELDRQLGPLTDALQILPPMLGADGPRRYLLAIQSNNEARGTGGFLGSWAVLGVDDGTVTIEEMAPRRYLDRQVYDTLPLDFGPDYAAFYGDQPGSWSSANLSPNFPYAARLWLKYWQDRTGEQLDGVLTTDPVATAYLLDAVGGFQLPDGRVLDSHNFVRFTESSVYAVIDDDADRDKYLKMIGRISLTRVLRFVGSPRHVVDALGKAVGEHRLLAYSTDPAEEEQLQQTVVGGTLPTGPGPFAAVALNNAAGNKADYYIGQELRYDLLGCGADTQQTRITVTLTNAIPKGADLPYYVIGRNDLATPSDPRPTRGGDTADWVQIYTAEGALMTGATLDGDPVEVQQGTERGRPVYRVAVTVPASGSATVTLDLVEPLAAGPARTWTTPLVKPAVVSTDSFECTVRN